MLSPSRLANADLPTPLSSIDASSSLPLPPSARKPSRIIFEEDDAFITAQVQARAADKVLSPGRLNNDKVEGTVVQQPEDNEDDEDDLYAPAASPIASSSSATAALSATAFQLEQHQRDREANLERLTALAHAEQPSSLPIETAAPKRKSTMVFEEEEGFEGIEMMMEVEQEVRRERQNRTAAVAPKKVKENVSVASTSVSAPPPFAPKESSVYGSSYTTKYSSSLSNLNLGRTISIAPVTALTFAGKKVVFPRRRKLVAYEESAQEKRDNTEALAKLSHDMLETPYYSMVNDIQRESKLARKLAEADAANANLGQEDKVSAVPDGMLWTDRYRPKKFVDLLGDERVHRSALLWLKEWDQCVFKGAKTNAAAQLQKERRKKRALDAKNGPHPSSQRTPTTGGGGGGETTFDTPLDPLGRPYEKILLLSGPPGLGKTTLAHVLATQAGYRVHEVNASDDRNASAVEERIRNALESRAIGLKGDLGSNRPTCLVVDEIDGASGDGFIKALVRLVMDGTKINTYKGKGKKKEKLPLVRPIICICNNLYAPALRPLRAISKIVRFSPPTNLMLVGRLRNICTEEGLTVDSKNLTLLTEVAEGDLRSCLNTLQFIKKKGNLIDANSIRYSSVGKDTGVSPNVVIENLFRKPARVKGGGGNQDEKWLDRIERQISTCAEWNRISQGFFHNYLGAKPCSDDLARASSALEWLSFHQTLEHRTRADRDWALFKYLPYALAPLYKLFATHLSKTLDFGSVEWEMFLQQQAHEEVATNFTKTLPTAIKSMYTSSNLVSELLPLLNRIISPDLKPVNRQLIKSDERVVMLKLISTMLETGLSFVQDKNEDGQLTYKLDPPIDVFVHFEGKRAPDLPQSRYAVRHLVTQEMQQEQVRRSKAGTDGSVAHTAKDIINAYKTNPNGKLLGKVDVKQAVDFFGRAVICKPQTAEEAAAPAPPPRARNAVYRFHEGFSNAVRVTKRVADFL